MPECATELNYAMTEFGRIASRDDVEAFAVTFWLSRAFMNLITRTAILGCLAGRDQRRARAEDATLVRRDRLHDERSEGT
jgi:hypothetical protein